MKLLKNEKVRVLGCRLSYFFFGCRFPVGSYAIQSIIKSTTSQFSTKAHLDQVWFKAVCVFVLELYKFFLCCVGADLLLQSEGTRLSDEERPRSFGNHQAEPTLDG